MVEAQRSVIQKNFSTSNKIISIPFTLLTPPREPGHPLKIEIHFFPLAEWLTRTRAIMRGCVRCNNWLRPSTLSDYATDSQIRSIPPSEINDYIMFTQRCNLSYFILDLNATRTKTQFVFHASISCIVLHLAYLPFKFLVEIRVSNSLVVGVGLLSKYCVF